MDEKRALMRHMLATVAYRGGKAVRDAPSSFATFQAGDDTRSPEAILAHIGDLMDWGLSLAKGAQAWHNSTPLPWDDEISRFFEALARFDEYLASESALACVPERLFQGPIADALTHVGQIALLRRLAGAPIKGENYYRAEIASGRVTRDQPAPRQEFA